MYKRVQDIQSELSEYRLKGVIRGYQVGFDWNDLKYTIKKGCTTYIGAAPASGKTEFIFEMMINLSCLYGWKHCLFTPETGDAKEIYAELCSKFIGKPYIGKNKMSETDRIYAEQFVNDHFVVVDPVDEDLTYTKFYKLVDDIENELSIKFDTTLVDPHNEMTEEYTSADGGREDRYLSRILKLIRVNARKTNRHNFVVNHVRDQGKVTVGDIQYYPPPHVREFAGGQVWFRKGLGVIILWRPPFGLADENGRPYEKNEVHVIIAKAKPKGVSRKGRFSLFYNEFLGRYYVRNEDGTTSFSDRGKYNTSQKKLPEQTKFNNLQPNTNF